MITLLTCGIRILKGPQSYIMVLISGLALLAGVLDLIELKPTEPPQTMGTRDLTAHAIALARRCHLDSVW